VGVTPDEVLAWHRLTMAYEDKLGAGRYSAWEYIFFAEFWLDHEAVLKAGSLPDPLAHHLDQTSPDHKDFYIRALQRFRECGDDRQMAIGHSLYLRFAQAHLQGDERLDVVEEQGDLLVRLLGSQTNGHLLKTLEGEGYAARWPLAVLKWLKKRQRTEAL
jgi:hypothetical protein